MAAATLRTVGNSVAVVIPKQWLTVLGLAAGEKVEMKLEGQRLTLQALPKSPRRQYKLADLLAKCDQSAPLPTTITEWDGIKPEGKEVW